MVGDEWVAEGGKFCIRLVGPPYGGGATLMAGIVVRRRAAAALASGIRAPAPGTPHGGPVAADDRRQDSGRGFRHARPYDSRRWPELQLSRELGGLDDAGGQWRADTCQLAPRQRGINCAQASGRTLLPVVKFVGRNPVAALQLAVGEPAAGDRQHHGGSLPRRPPNRPRRRRRTLALIDQRHHQRPPGPSSASIHVGYPPRRHDGRTKPR